MYSVSIEGSSIRDLISNIDALLVALKQQGAIESKAEVPMTNQVHTNQQKEPVSTMVPTMGPTYTLDQLERAGVALLDAGRGGELIALLNSQFGISNMQELPHERYGEFATAIRRLGAKI